MCHGPHRIPDAGTSPQVNTEKTWHAEFNAFWVDKSRSTSAEWPSEAICSTTGSDLYWCTTKPHQATRIWQWQRGFFFRDIQRFYGRFWLHDLTHMAHGEVPWSIFKVPLHRSPQRASIRKCRWDRSKYKSVQPSNDHLKMETMMIQLDKNFFLTVIFHVAIFRAGSGDDDPRLWSPVVEMTASCFTRPSPVGGKQNYGTQHCDF